MSQNETLHFEMAVKKCYLSLPAEILIADVALLSDQIL